MFGLFETWQRVLRDIKLNLPATLVFALFFRVLGFLVFAPLVTYGLSNLIHSTGDLAITNADIAAFVLSPTGIAFAGLSIILVLVGFFAEQGGYMMVIAAGRAGEKVRVVQVFCKVVARLPQLLAVAAAQTVIMLVCLLPFGATAAGVYWALLSTHDINWYLNERPPEFIAALVIGGVLAFGAAVVAAVLVVRWALAIPVCVFEKRSGLSALRRSRELVHGHKVFTGTQILGWVVLTSVVAMAGAFFADWLAGELLSRISGIRFLITAMALILGTTILASLAMAFVVTVGYAIISFSLFDELSGSLPVVLHGEVEQTSPRIGLTAVAAVLVAVVGVSIFAARDLASELSLNRKVEITAHRGSSKTAPENTLSAIRQAIEDGADYAEIDVQETGDGTVVLIHDSDLLRIAGNPVKIWEVRDAVLASLDAGSWFAPEFKSERVPTLKQAIDLSRGKIKLNIELKYNGHDKALAKRVVDIVVAEGFGDDSFIASLEARGVAEVQALAPQLKTGQIVTVAVGKPENLPVKILSMNQSLVSARQVRLNRKAGRETHVWTVNTMPGMLEMIDRGVDNIITDEPAMAKKVIAERAELSSAELLLLALSRKVGGS